MTRSAFGLKNRWAGKKKIAKEQDSKVIVPPVGFHPAFHTMKTALILVVIAALIPIAATNAAPAAAAPVPDPAKTVQAFYDCYFSHHSGCDKRTIKATRQYFTPALYKALLAEFSKPVPKGEVPDIDWDVFTASQDTPVSYKTGKTSARKETATVEIAMVWNSTNDKQTLILHLARSDRDWKIADIYYPGERGTLTALLNPKPEIRSPKPEIRNKSQRDKD